MRAGENAGASADRPVLAYTPESSAWAIAKSGSSSMARLRCGIASTRGTDPALIERERIRMERFERRRRRAREWDIESLNRRQRLAKLFTQPGSGIAQGRQDLFLARHFHLFARHDVAGFGIDRLERDDIVAAEAADRSGNERLQAAHAARSRARSTA